MTQNSIGINFSTREILGYRVFYFEGLLEGESAFTASSNFAFPWCSRISSSSNPRSAMPLSQRNFAAHSIALLGSRSCFEISSSLCHAPSTSRIQTYQRSMGFPPNMVLDMAELSQNT